MIISFTLQSKADSDKCKSAILADHTCFQYGNDWGKTLIPDNTSFEMPAQLVPAVKGTFQTMVGGSGILLGTFNGEYVAATAYHTCLKATGGQCSPIHVNPNFRLRLLKTLIVGFYPKQMSFV